MRNYFNSMKKIKFSLFFLLSVFGLCAQSPILVLEAENADSIHSPARVKSGDGFSNGKYVGGNDRGSYLFFHNVTMEKALFQLQRCTSIHCKSKQLSRGRMYR